jgi:CBS domain-containing protein
VYEFLDYLACDAMTRDPVTVTPGASLGEVEGLLEQHGWNALPVVEGSRLVGVVTSLDLLKAFRFTPDRLFPPYLEIMRSPVSSVMRHEVETVAPRTPLPRALEKMVRTRNKSLPVVEDDEVVGILTRADVMGALRRAVAGEKPRGPA